MRFAEKDEHKAYMNMNKDCYSRKKKHLGEQGQIMPLALVVFLILALIEGALITEGYLERRISLNDINAKQARQAADAGLEWVREDLRHKLLLYDDFIPLLWYDGKEVKISDSNTVTFIINKLSMETPVGDYYVFTVECTGKTNKARCRLLAKLRFDYEIADEYAITGKVFKKGRIIHYELPDSL